MAELSWTLSTAPSFSESELRGLLGPDYDTEDDGVIENFAPGAPRTLTGDFGLSVPGSSASFRIYVKTDTGNEVGSNTITNTRPVT